MTRKSEDKLQREANEAYNRRRFLMRNGHNSQAPDETREQYNMRVHGLSEEDFE